MDLNESSFDDVNLAFLGSGAVASLAVRSVRPGLRLRAASWDKPSLREEAALNRLIGARICEARELAGFNAGELAQLIGLAKADMDDLEAGRADVPVWLLRRIADRCVTTVDFLVGDTEESERGEITPTLRDLLVRQQQHNDRLRMAEVLEQDSLRTRLDVLEGLAGLFHAAAQEAERALQRVTTLNPEWPDMRGGSKLQDGVARCAVVAGRLGRRMARLKAAKAAQHSPLVPA